MSELASAHFFVFVPQIAAGGSALVTCTVLTDFKGMRYLHQLQLGLGMCNTSAPESVRYKILAYPHNF